MTKMDELGKQGWTPFTQYYQRIWKLYNRYGDRVIEVEFEEEGQEGQDEVKNIFLKTKNERTLLEELTELWIKKYQIIINSCADIEKVYSELTNKEETIFVYPEGKSEVLTRRFYITREFFLKMYNKIYEANFEFYMLTEKSIYKIRIISKEAIKIEKKIPIASMLKDE